MAEKVPGWEKTERIGGITLDYTHYSGEDLYSDGAVEDELLEIVRNYPESEYPRIIEERLSWPILYHLSPLRENIVDWIPMDPGSKVLEVGSGCGAVTGSLSRKAESVTCVDLSRRRSLINAYRHRDRGNVTVHVGNFSDIEPDLPCDYDVICLIGAFEYGQCYLPGDRPYEDFLRIIKKHAGKQGRILIAIENRLGLKYFAGCTEDHLGDFFSGIEDYPENRGARTFSRNGLERIFAACGIEEYSFYYPYPDYKLMTALYSDRYLPRYGELTRNLANFDRDRLVLFDEKRAFDGILKDGLFPVFSNSYLAVLGKAYETEYVRYSNDRAPEYALRTEIRQGEVRKQALFKEGREHILRMEHAYRALTRRYEGGHLAVNRCRLEEKADEVAAVFDFEPGSTLEEQFDRLLERDDFEGFRKLFGDYVSRIGRGEEQETADYDMAFSNILIDGEKWTLIDYEWTLDGAVSARELAYRALYCYLLADKKREKINVKLLLEQLGISDEEAAGYREKEQSFQRHVTGQRRSLIELRDLIGYRLRVPETDMELLRRKDVERQVRIYEDRGKGYREEDSYVAPDPYQGEQLLRFRLEVGQEVERVRVDPALESCVVTVRRLRWNGKELPLGRKTAAVSGRKIGHRTYAFADNDPWISIECGAYERRERNILEAELEIALIPRRMAQALVNKSRWQARQRPQ